jgi:hypothetical protein
MVNLIIHRSLPRGTPPPHGPPFARQWASAGAAYRKELFRNQA